MACKPHEDMAIKKQLRNPEQPSATSACLGQIAKDTVGPMSEGKLAKQHLSLLLRPELGEPLAALLPAAASGPPLPRARRL